MMTQRAIWTIVVLHLFMQDGLSQVNGHSTEHVGRNSSLSGTLSIDLLEQALDARERRDSVHVSMGTKSGLNAAVYSMLVPGAGEFYVGEYVKAGGFFAAEVGLWVVYALYTSKGDDQTDLFQEFADRHWSVVQYADWIERNGLSLNPAADPQKLNGLYDRGRVNAPPWERIYWDRLNIAETEIGKKTGTYFSHQLPRRPEQQYYELIGKYGQYNPGWEDGKNVDVNNFHSELTRMFLDYSKMRGKANDFYNIATTATKLVVLNHVLSALDAAWSAAMHNRSLTVEAHLWPVQRPFGIVEFVPTARLKFEF